MSNKFELQKELAELLEEISKTERLNEELKLNTAKLREQYNSKKTANGRDLPEEVLENINNQIISNGGRAGELLLTITQLKEKSEKIEDQLSKFVEPICPKCEQTGNIFEYRGVPPQSTSIDTKLITDENLPKNRIFIIYCTKCGHIVGTAGKA